MNLNLTNPSVSQPASSPISAPESNTMAKDIPAGDEREMVIDALERSGWVKAKAARLLNMTPLQIAYRIQIMNIEMKQI